MTKRVRCQSGLMGWQSRLRENYDNSYRSFLIWTRMYNIHGRLGYATPKEAWQENPIIQGSVEPSDLCKVVNGKRVPIPELAERPLDAEIEEFAQSDEATKVARQVFAQVNRRSQ